MTFHILSGCFLELYWQLILVLTLWRHLFWWRPLDLMIVKVTEFMGPSSAFLSMVLLVSPFPSYPNGLPIHLVFLSLFLAKLLDSSHFINWFSFTTWSAIEDLVCLDSESFRVALVNFFVPNLFASTTGYVYEIPCYNCKKVYIGETGTLFGNRRKERHCFWTL